MWSETGVRLEAKVTDRAVCSFLHETYPETNWDIEVTMNNEAAEMTEVSLDRRPVFEQVEATRVDVLDGQMTIAKSTSWTIESQEE